MWGIHYTDYEHTLQSVNNIRRSTVLYSKAASWAICAFFWIDSWEELLWKQNKRNKIEVQLMLYLYFDVVCTETNIGLTIQEITFILVSLFLFSEFELHLECYNNLYSINTNIQNT